MGSNDRKKPSAPRPGRTRRQAGAARPKHAREAPTRAASSKVKAPSPAAPRPPPTRTAARPRAGFALDLGDGFESALRTLQGEAKRFVNKGRYTKLRVKLRGKPILPDLPLAAVVAAEAATFYWVGLLRVAVFHLVGKSVLDIELINDADEVVEQGREQFLAGELEGAAKTLERAIQMDRDHAAAHLHLGVIRKLQGDREASIACFRKARSLAPEGPAGKEAGRQLEGLLAVR